MKTNHLFVPLLTVALLTATACSRNHVETARSADPIPAKLPPPPEIAPVPPVTGQNPTDEMNALLNQATREQHNDLADAQSRMDRTINEQVAAWKGAGHNVPLAADQKLDAATRDFAETVRMLTLAPAETWTTTKNNAQASLANVQAAYREVMASDGPKP